MYIGPGLSIGEAFVEPVATALGLTLPGSAIFFPKSQLAEYLNQATYDFFRYTFAYGTQLWNLAFKPIVDQIQDFFANKIPTLESIATVVTAAFATQSIDTVRITDAIIDVIKTQLSDVLAQSFKTFADTTSIIITGVNDYTRFWASSAEEKLLGIWSDLKDFRNTELSELAKTHNAITGVAFYLRTIIKEELDQIQLSLGGNIVDAMKTILDELTGVTDAIKQSVNDALKNLAPQITAGFSVFLQGAQDQLNTLISQSFESVTTIVNSTLTQLGELEYYISTEFKFWVGEAAEYIINSLKAADQNFGQIMDTLNGMELRVEGAIGGIAVQSQAYYADLTKQMDYTLAMFATTVSDQLTGIWTGFKDTIITPIAKDWENFTLGLTNQFNSFFAAVGCEATAISNWFGGIFNQISQWIQSLCGKDCQRDISNNLPDPFNLITRSLTSVIGVGGGLGLSLTLGEFVHPLKSLGLSRLAAYFWDMADFKAVGGAVLGALNSASTVKPLQYGLNEFFRPHMPDTKTADTWLFKGLIQEFEWETIYKRHGFADHYIDAWRRDRYTEPSDRMLIALAETPGVTQEWLDLKIRARGYDALDEELFKTYVTKRRLSDEFGRLISAYRAAFIKGYVDYEQFGNIIKATGRSELEYAWMLESANRERDTKRLDEDISEYVQSFRTDKLNLDQFEAGIYALPLVPERAANIIELEVARKRVRSATDKAAKQARLSVPQIMKGFDFGWFNDDDVVIRLQLLDYNLEDSQLILAIHKGEIAAKEADTTQAAQLKAEREAVAEETRLATEWARFLLAAISYRQLSADQVKALIAELPLSDARKAIFYNEADLISSRPAQEGTAAKPKTLRETDVYKALFNNLITYEDAINYLVNKGYTQEQATLLLQLNAPDYLPPAL